MEYLYILFSQEDDWVLVHVQLHRLDLHLVYHVNDHAPVLVQLAHLLANQLIEVNCLICVAEVEVVAIRLWVDLITPGHVHVHIRRERRQIGALVQAIPVEIGLGLDQDPDLVLILVRIPGQVQEHIDIVHEDTGEVIDTDRTLVAAGHLEVPVVGDNNFSIWK